MYSAPFCHDIPLAVIPKGLVVGSRACGAFCQIIDLHRSDRPAGSFVKLEGEVGGRVYVLLSGWLILAQSLPSGHRQIVDVVLPGGVLDPASADSETSMVEIQALTDVTIAACPGAEWARLLEEHPAVENALRGMNAALLARLFGRMLRLGKGNAESIFAFSLCELFIRSAGGCLMEGRKVHIPMTQQQLADFCGLSAVHVCRTLRRFRRLGILDMTDHTDFVIRDLGALAAMGEFDPVALRRDLIVPD